MREDSDETSALWTVGRVCLWPNALFTGNHFEWRVPIDDTSTLSVGWFFSRVPKDREPFVQDSIPCWYSPIVDDKTGRWITSHIMNQDFVGWVGQGAITDRRREHLGRSDRGIIMMRQRFFKDLDTVAGGGEPKAIVRDPAGESLHRAADHRAQALCRGLTREEVEGTCPGIAPRRFPVPGGASPTPSGAPMTRRWGSEREPQSPAAARHSVPGSLCVPPRSNPERLR